MLSIAKYMQVGMDSTRTSSALTGKGEMMMDDREKVIKRLEVVRNAIVDGYIHELDWAVNVITDAIALLKEHDSFLGVQQTADSITFISTGTAQQGEERGILLGKSFMHEWIYKELLYKGLLTDDIRLVFEQAKHI